MKAIDEVSTQLKALGHISMEELNEFCRKHGQRMKPILEISLLVVGEKWGELQLLRKMKLVGFAERGLFFCIYLIWFFRVIF